MKSRSLLLATVATCLSVSACSKSTAETPSTSAIKVMSTNTTCEVAKAELAAGRQTFQIENKGSSITEAYVYAEGDRIMGEVENLGPSITRELKVDLPAGTYELACKPGMTGNGIRQKLTVTGTSATTAPQTSLVDAVAQYRSYVEAETQALVEPTTAFTSSIKTGNVSQAKRDYASARLHYERIEPIAESFGDLDPLIDMRIDDATEQTPFVGFHKLEQDLWEKGDINADASVATDLQNNVKKLADLVKTVELTTLTMTNGAKSLLDEVAKSKVTGEEERYSHIDLVDFAGNIDGAKAVFTQLYPAISTKNPALAATLETRFKSLETELDKHRTGTAYVPHTALTAADVKTLASEVDALSEPLGQLGTIVD